jgi:hypothetical protein
MGDNVLRHGMASVIHWAHRTWQRLLHHFNYHHVKVCHLEDGTVQDWCPWCGLRMNRLPTTRPSGPKAAKAHAAGVPASEGHE